MQEHQGSVFAPVVFTEEMNTVFNDEGMSRAYQQHDVEEILGFLIQYVNPSGTLEHKVEMERYYVTIDR